MDSQNKIYRLLRLSFIEIRQLANAEGDMKNIYALSDLMHNIPAALNKPDADYDKILNDIVERASTSQALSNWVTKNSSAG